MPILHVRALPQKHPRKIKTALKKTIAAIARVYGCDLHQVWATWEEIKPGYYCEGDIEKNQQLKTTHPPICEIICFEGKKPNEVKSGRVIAGNGIVRKKL